MSGHSKWATIKRKKGAIDKAKGKTFAKLARQLEVATREGASGDISSNAALRTIVSKAKAAHMTNDAIDRAIKRGLGEQSGASYESITYEAYAPGGVAMLIDALPTIAIAPHQTSGRCSVSGAARWQSPVRWAGSFRARASSKSART